MADATYTLGETPDIAIAHCGGDLQLEAHGGQTVVVSTSEHPASRQESGRLAIERVDDDLRLRVPVDARVRIGRVDGDASVRGLAAVAIDHVGGDLRLRRVRGGCAVRHLDGDLSAEEVGDLSIKHVGGDAEVGEVTGALVLGNVDGDARLSATLRSGGRLHVGGDLSLRGGFHPGEYDLGVDGNAEITLPEGANVAISARADGDVEGLQAMRGGYGATYGDGAASVRLAVGGDLTVRGPIRTVLGGWESPAAPPPPPSLNRLVPVAPAITPPEPPALPERPEAHEPHEPHEAHEPQLSHPADRPTPLVTGVAAATPAPPQMTASLPKPGDQDNVRIPSDPAQPDNTLSVLEALARGELSPEEAERALATGVEA